MSKYTAVAREQDRSPGEGPLKSGGKGELLYKFRETLPWYLLGIFLYTVVAIATLSWTLTGPTFTPGPWKRVMQTGHLPVDQLYSGLGLSALLTPAAIMIRKIFNDLGQLHPFSIAARKPVRIDDLDRMVDVGLFSIKATFSYSKWSAVVQAVTMIAGASLVPIGALIVTTDQFNFPQTRGMAFVGMPMGTLMTQGMGVTLGWEDLPAGLPDYGTVGNDLFMSLVVDYSKGRAIGLGALLLETPEFLGPVATTNITFEAGVVYDGVISYSWDAGCKPTNDIQYTITQTNTPYVTFTFPDGQVNSTYVAGLQTILWSDAEAKSSQGIPIGGATYFATAGPVKSPKSLPKDTAVIEVQNGTWIARVKCNPRLNWEISSCKWNGTVMGNCTSAPHHSTTEIDITGLNATGGYLSRTVWGLNSEDQYYLGNIPDLSVPLVYHPGVGTPDQIRAPELADYINLYGLIAESIVTVSTAGGFGGAMVHTLGVSIRQVYIARIYILVIVVIILVMVSSLAITDLIFQFTNGLPFRKATFLTIANAVRGPWWDNQLDGGCVLHSDDLRKQNKAEVMFGVTSEHHVGLGQVSVVDRNATYYGVQRRNRRSSL